MRVVNVKRINSQVTNGGYDIEEPELVNISVNELDTCCIGSNFMVLRMTSRTADLYPYNPSCTPMYHFPIVSGAPTVTDSITGN